MTQQVGGWSPGAAPPPERWEDVVAPGPPGAARGVGQGPVDAHPRRARAGGPPAGRAGRLGTAVSAVLLLALFAGDLAVALGLPVLTSTCADRVCGPGLAAGAGAAGAGLVAVVAWLVGDARRDGGRGGWLRWAALFLAAAPWALALPAVRWW